MKKLLMLLVAFGLVFGASFAMAESAVVVSDVGCNVYNGDGDVVSATSGRYVETMSNNGNLILKCSAKKLINTDKKAVRFDFSTAGVLCSTPYGYTEDWFNQVSASGNSTLTCFVKEEEVE